MPDKAEKLFRRGNNALRQGDPATAIRFYNKSLELSPGVMEALVNKAGAHMDLHRYDEALATIDEAIRATPNYAKLHGIRGDILAKLGRYNECEDAYNEAIWLDPSDSRFVRYRDEARLQRYGSDASGQF